ncbi:hypothetical protein HOF56_01945 [Candidatus Peribacteria bacterium]|jgi:uncharacterized protein YkwD|nr:hypothetical protein [Candidatus Peribacteria bacterium]MBT4240397.1 hypothetical protein [Candidatus Peribacteria bacterium]MBT4473820.1 hypothetical protein [Candidatus Peribacteria bacterium]
MRRMIIALALLLPTTAQAVHLTDNHFEEIKTHLLNRINESRQKNGTSAISYSKNIQRVAQGHADDLASHFDPKSTETREATYLAHTSSDGRALNARFRDAEVETGWQFSENVGYWIREPFDGPGIEDGAITIKASKFGVDLMHDGMMAEVPPNDSHKKNILGNYTHVGMGLSLLNNPGSALNTIFMVTNYSRYQSKEEEIDYRTSIHFASSTSPRSLQNSIEASHGGPFEDVNLNHKFANEIEKIKEAGIVSGYDDGTFKPDKTVNRAEFIKMMMDSVGLSPIGMEFNACFEDVFNQWFAPYVCIAKRKGWVNGYADNSYRPDREVNRAEAIAMASRIIDIERSGEDIILFNDVSPDSWFSEPLQELASNNLVPSSYETWFRPERGMTRGEMAYIAYQVMLEKGGAGEERSGPERSLLGH